MLPAWSVARASKVWLPSLSAGERVSGLEQAVQEPPSILHSKLEPVSVEANEKLGVVLFEGSVGCVVIAGAAHAFTTWPIVPMLSPAPVLPAPGFLKQALIVVVPMDNEDVVNVTRPFVSGD